MRALIIGGTGKVGGACLAELRARGVDAVAACRNAPAGGVRLDLADAASVEAGARGFTHAFLVTPLGPDETDIGLAAVAALRRAGVAKIVYLAIMNLERMRAIPHFETKIPVKQAVLSDGRSVVIEPNFFMQNDAMVLPAILHAGVYPLPIGSVGVWSVDVGDIGLAAANALTNDSWDGQPLPVCGPERVTGESAAADWAQAAGRPVAYAGDAIPPFIGAIERAFPMDDWTRHDMAEMMRVTQALGCTASPEQQAASRAIIGREPTRHADFARGLLAAHNAMA